MGKTISIVSFVVAVLILAATLIFWKPGQKTKYRFIRLSLGNLLIHLMDGFITFVNTPDLTREANPLVSKLGYGWGALFLANLIGFFFIVLCAWCFCKYEHIPIKSVSTFDYFMKLFHGENYKPVWFWYKWSKNYRSMFAMCSYAFYWGMTAGASIFVIGWIMDMLDIYPFWWDSTWIAMGICILVCFICIYKWTRDGYKLGIEHE